MGRLRKQVLAIVSLLMLTALLKLAQGQLRPTCLSQFAVVNQACALLPIGDGPEQVHAFNEEQVAQSSSEQRNKDDGGQGHHRHEGGEGHHGQGHNGGQHRHEHEGGEHHQGHGHEGQQHHGHGHEGSERRQGHGHGHGHEGEQHHAHGGHEGGERHGHEGYERHDGRGEHHHGHGHGHRHHRRVDERCCRWLRETDEGCVCTALLALPRFLINPDHAYTLQVGSVCKLTFNCAGIFG